MKLERLKYGDVKRRGKMRTLWKKWGGSQSSSGQPQGTRTDHGLPRVLDNALQRQSHGMQHIRQFKREFMSHLWILNHVKIIDPKETYP